MTTPTHNTNLKRSTATKSDRSIPTEHPRIHSKPAKSNTQEARISRKPASHQWLVPFRMRLHFWNPAAN
uniref:Uncharacterized protein n=1 Tax=Arundo donax TaxID=35708 RepID=A0A0A9G950_ARUDO